MGPLRLHGLVAVRLFLARGTGFGLPGVIGGFTSRQERQPTQAAHEDCKNLLGFLSEILSSWTTAAISWVICASESGPSSPPGWGLGILTFTLKFCFPSLNQNRHS